MQADTACKASVSENAQVALRWMKFAPSIMGLYLTAVLVPDSLARCNVSVGHQGIFGGQGVLVFPQVLVAKNQHTEMMA